MAARVARVAQARGKRSRQQRFLGSENRMRDFGERLATNV